MALTSTKKRDHGERTKARRRADREGGSGQHTPARPAREPGQSSDYSQPGEAVAARKNGLQDQDEPSEVRSLNHDAEARAQAEAAMQQMMAKSQAKKPRRW